MMLAVQVVFNQGQIKTFVCDDSLSVRDFALEVAKHGKMKVIRKMDSVPFNNAMFLVNAGNATHIRKPEAL